MEGFLLHLCGQKLIMEEEDRVQWMEFSRESHFTKPRAGFLSFVSNEEHLEVVCAAKSKLLCLRGILG